MILKIILLVIQTICLLIWADSIFIGIQGIPEMIRKREGGWTCAWWGTVFIVMIGAFGLTLHSKIHFSILTLVIGLLTILIFVYIFLGILLTTGWGRPSEPMKAPLIKAYLIYCLLLELIYLIG